ncbi:MAG: carbamoyl-phosphate synthase large subunit [Crocinitomicaceae bacterium]|nr:carbamoyl-phosphate synthase large subunit [Crocinitomicaceae bacterium]
MPKNNSIKSVLIIGSGPIVIGQACEFDYSGTQAAKALREEGIEVTLINSNPATIMTDKMTADNVYLKPLEPESIIEILKTHKIDAVLPTMGGQTALNLSMKCDEMGIWEEYNVQMIGADVDAIKIAEDRELFKEAMEKIGMKLPAQKTARSFLEGKEIAQKFGFPLCVRSSFTLGGAGAAFVHTKEEFDTLLERGLELSPIHEVMIDKALIGWREYEYEVIRDAEDNMMVVCCIENFDPMGIHTGDSITVAPALALAEETYEKMREQAFKMVRSMGEFVGGCNVQFAVSPDDSEVLVVEINPRVSRSSALASKATGFPIAKIATKLALGYTLREVLKKSGGAEFNFKEPNFDYVIVKIPRWNFNKFKGANRELGLQMKSVGEVMGIGRNFQEALQKACQSLEIGRNGLGADGKELTNQQEILQSLENPSWNRLFHIYDAIKLGIPFKTIQDKTKIDIWYLRQIEELIDLERKIEKHRIDDISRELMLEAKERGYADRQIAHLLRCLESEVYKKREELGVKRVFNVVDPFAPELEEYSPFYYSTFGVADESPVTPKKKVVILGSGPNRIGQGIEFDYSCVHGVLAAKECGYETIMINCNPETVSTDADTADKLYFEPVFWEHIYDIIQHEKPEGVIVQLGGQTALKLAEKLNRYGIPIIGTSFEALDLAEDRGRFSKMLEENNVLFPKYGVVESAEQALELSKDLGFPLLVRPSYVLGGQKMKIVINEEELEQHVVDIIGEMGANHILLDHFIGGAVECEADAICDGENVYIIGIMQHIEPAGIHSGDSYAVLPPYNLGDLVMTQIIEITKKVAVALKTVGLINIQYVVKDDKVYVIEANPRASRTVPFIAKAYDEPYVNYATKIMLGEKKVTDFTFNPKKEGYAIKIPVFSYNKFPEVKKELGPEMKSTGEAIQFIKDLRDPFFMDIYAKRNMHLSR